MHKKATVDKKKRKKEEEKSKKKTQFIVNTFYPERNYQLFALDLAFSLQSGTAI